MGTPLGDFVRAKRDSIQELVVLLPADEMTAQTMERLRRQPGGTLRAIG
jgi:hypothetical protein